MLFNQLKKPETTQDMHVLNVYKDPEFMKEVKSQFPELEAWIDIEKAYEMPDGSMDHRSKMNMFYGVEKLDDKQFYELALKYAVHVNDIKIFLMGRHHTGNVYGARRSYALTPNTGGDWVANIPTDISKDDFMKMWVEIKRNKSLQFLKKLPKTKPPTYDKLLYAIFKARQRNETFTQIFKQYENKELPYYEGGISSMFRNDQDKFEEYYRKYKPTP